MVKRASWLSITPELERELPEAVATMAAGHRADANAVAAERTRVERLILRGSRRRWLAYLHDVVGVIAADDGRSDPDVAAARARARAVITNHHQLLLGLPGDGARRTATDLSRLRALNDHELGAS